MNCSEYISNEQQILNNCIRKPQVISGGGGGGGGAYPLHPLPRSTPVIHSDAVFEPYKGYPSVRSIRKMRQFFYLPQKERETLYTALSRARYNAKKDNN